MYTDANGLYMMKREYQKRQDFQPVYNKTDILSGNTYPVSGLAYIEDVQSKQKLVVITDRPQGFVSVDNGDL